MNEPASELSGPELAQGVALPLADRLLADDTVRATGEYNT